MLSYRLPQWLRRISPGVRGSKRLAPSPHAEALRTLSQFKHPPLAGDRASLLVEPDARISFDAGHGGTDPGAQHNGIVESSLNLALARYAKLRLEHSYEPVAVALTRTTDEYLSLRERGEASERQQADLVVSIHCNAATSTAQHGAMAFALPGDIAALDVARTILRCMPKPLNCGTRYAFSADADADTDSGRNGVWLQRVRNVLSPHYPRCAVLLEVGYLSHIGDARALECPAVQSGIVTAIMAGVDRYRRIVADSRRAG